MLARWTMANRLKWYAKLFSHLMLCRVLYLSFFQCEDDFAPAHSQKNWPSQQVSQPSCIQSFLQGSAAVHLTCKHIHTRTQGHTHILAVAGLSKLRAGGISDVLWPAEPPGGSWCRETPPAAVTHEGAWSYQWPLQEWEKTAEFVFSHTSWVLKQVFEHVAKK